MVNIVEIQPPQSGDPHQWLGHRPMSHMGEVSMITNRL